MAVITPQHPRWREFCQRLHEALGGGPSGCNGGDDAVAHEGARAILSTMEEVDLEGSLTWFREEGGECDCEILLNIAVPALESAAD